ncbi:MAG: T9SS type A sorting domain-containing protein [Bacteroidales bacterium]|jgi:aminopeptidase N|nr:T9SS type A sorting domain-containing protein [Bacteroidales bacterium]
MKIKYLIFIGLLLFSTLPLFAQSITDSVRIAHYDIQLSVLDFDGQRLEGNTMLKVVPQLANLPSIALDLAAFNVDSVKINNQTTAFQRPSNKVIVDLPTNHQLGDTVEITIFYQGIPEKDTRWGGFYFSSGYAFNMGVAMTRLPHSYGRCWYPCLDVFTDKSTYDFHITTTADKMAVCSGKFVDTAHTSEGNIIWHWTLAQPVPTYLTSVAVGDYAHYQDSYQGLERTIPIDIYVHPTRLGSVEGSFENLKAILRYFENSFGAYQFDRIGYVGVNFNSGAMEHASNIAYPNSAVNGTLSYESLWIHELSHSWFGNLITCEKAEEMWINEGFARYCEILGEEFLYDTDGSSSQAKQTYRDLHRSVLKNTHTSDGGYFALNAVPQHVTYGSTSYDKGALIVHNLRHYLGDAQFYALMTEMLNDYMFDNISSKDFFQFLTNKSGLPMNDFLDAWVSQPGFLHFNVDSISCINATDEYRVYVREKLHHAEHYGLNQKIEITFFSIDKQEYTTTVTISGETDNVVVQLPFQPFFAVVDFHEKMSDALVDYQQELTETGMVTFAEASARVDVKRIGNPEFFRMEHHLVEPDPLKTPNDDIYRISPNHYWRVLYFPNDDFEPQLQFKYSTIGTSAFDTELFLDYEINDLVLLYRKDAHEDWQIVHYTRIGNSNYTGYLAPSDPQPGEYCLAMGNSALSIKDHKSSQIFLKPNPANQRLDYFVTLSNPVSYVEISDLSGKILHRKVISENNGSIAIEFLPVGSYVVVFGNAGEKVVGQFVKVE